MSSPTKLKAERAHTRTKLDIANSLFMCQNENENQSFGSFWNLCVMNEPILQWFILLMPWLVGPRLYPEKTKTFVFGFVFH